ncbi:unnamed protein product [Durusdinium trenchii]|uniref:Uncharacterized protein n=2 Tax=Durusdinium trenchii TaxID=1381693 RepID=A0ABP0Q0S9_9DINO
MVMARCMALALLTVASAWECPSGYGGPKECLGEDGLCDLEKPMNVAVESCMEPKSQEKMEKGSYWKGCGLQDGGLDDACCNCWPLTQSSQSAQSSLRTSTAEFCPWKSHNCEGVCCVHHFWCWGSHIGCLIKSECPCD